MYVAHKISHAFMLFQAPRQVQNKCRSDKIPFIRRFNVYEERRETERERNATEIGAQAQDLVENFHYISSRKVLVKCILFYIL